MAGKYITLDDALVEQIQHISGVIPVDSKFYYKDTCITTNVI